MPDGYLQPDAAQALNNLVAAGYADSLPSVISRALLEAEKKEKKKSDKLKS